LIRESICGIASADAVDLSDIMVFPHGSRAGEEPVFASRYLTITLGFSCGTVNAAATLEPFLLRLPECHEIAPVVAE
jgi:hypothetical protein